MKKLLFWVLLISSAVAQQVNQDIIPASTGLNLGRTNQRWNAYIQNINITGTCTLNGQPCFGGGGGGSGHPANPFNSIQFNNSGAFGGSASLLFNPLTSSLTLIGTFLVNGNASITGTLTNTGLGVGGPFCLQATNGVISSTGSACGGGGGGGGVSGSGTVNTIPLWTASTNLGNSLITQTSIGGPAIHVGINTAPATSQAPFQIFQQVSNACVASQGIPLGNSPICYAGEAIAQSQAVTSASGTTTAFVGINFSSEGLVVGGVFSGIGNGTTVGEIRGLEGDAIPSGGGTPIIRGLVGYSGSGGATTTQQALYLKNSFTGGSVTTNGYGAYVDSPTFSSATVNNYYSLYLADSSAVGSNPWGIFEAGTAKNQLGGSLTLANLASAGTQCLHVNSSGLITGTGVDCGSGSSLPAGTGVLTIVGGVYGAVLSTTGTGNAVLSNSPTLVTPNLGTPSTLVLTNATGAPTWNQNTTGTAGNLLGCTPSTAGSVCIWNGSAWTLFAGNTSGTASLQENASGVPSWGSGSATTFQVNATPLISATTVNFQNSAATDGLTLTFTNGSAGNVTLGFTGTLTNAGLANSATTVNSQTCTLGSTCTIPFQVNGTPDTSQAGINHLTSTANVVGLTVTPVNSATNAIKFEISGGSYTGNAAGLFGTPSITVNGLTATTINGTTWAGTWAGSPTISGNPSFTGSPVFNMTGGPFCVQETAGVLSSTGVACGSGGGTVGPGTTNYVAYFTSATTIGSVGSAISGQQIILQNGTAPIASSPSLSDSGTAPVTPPYTIQCDSATTLLDRSTTLPVVGPGTVTVPLSSASGCAGLAVIVEAQAALTLTASGADTFTIYGNGGATLTAQTTFNLANGQTASLNQSSTGIWTVRLNEGGSVYNVSTGAGLTGGPCTGICTLSIPALGVTNGMLAGSIALGKLATQSANTVLGNFTSGTASPTATAVASCSGNNNGEIYTTNTGFGCGTNFGQLNVASTWTANQTLTGHLVITSHDITIPLACADTSASGTAQVCNTTPTFVPASGDRIAYTTTTANTGAGLTVNVNSLGAKSVAKWQTTTTLAANDIRANTQIILTYDGTNWEADTIGNTPVGSGTVTVVGAGSLTSTALVTGGGTQTLQTPSATSTLSAAGNMSLAGTFTAAGASTLPVAGAASTPGLKITGAAFTGGTSTTNTPQLYLMSAGSAVTTWSGNGTMFGIAPISGFTGMDIDLHAAAAGASVWSVDVSGNTLIAGTLGVTGHVTVEGVTSAGATGTSNFVFSASPTLTGTLTAATIAATTLSGGVNFSGTPTFANAVALGSSTATTQTACDNSTKLSTTAYTNTACTNIEASGSPLTLAGLSGYYYNDTAAAYTFQLDAPVAGKQYCFGNRKARSSAITIKSLASVTIYYKGVAGTAGTGGSLVSAGAVGDFVCMVGTDTTTYEATGSGLGTWTNN